MAKTSERPFGAMPPEMRTGPISVKNYDYRAEKHCADKSKSRDGMHPTITLESPDFGLWLEYFDRWLGGRPLCFRMLMDATIKEMTVPEPVPQWFDPSFVPGGARKAFSEMPGVTLN